MNIKNKLILKISLIILRWILINMNDIFPGDGIIFKKWL